MGLFSIVFLACALAMDAFAVSLCKGFAAKRLEFKHYFIVGAYFGGFQALMPALGYVIGGSFAEFVREIDHWIAFVLLAFVGAKMMKESFEGESCENAEAQFGVKTMLALAIATSIDALAVGVSFAFVEFHAINVWQSIALIGLITFAICAVGLKIGHKLGFNSPFGAKLGKKAEFIGGLVLIFLGAKILTEHLAG